MIFVHKGGQDKGRLAREKFIKNLLILKPDSARFTADELGFFSNGLFLCQSLAEFKPDLAYHYFNDIAIDIISESIHCRNCYNYAPTD